MSTTASILQDCGGASPAQSALDATIKQPQLPKPTPLLGNKQPGGENQSDPFMSQLMAMINPSGIATGLVLEGNNRDLAQLFHLPNPTSNQDCILNVKQVFILYFCCSSSTRILSFTTIC